MIVWDNVYGTQVFMWPLRFVSIQRLNMK